MSPASHLHREDRYQPGDLHIAARWVHRTRDRVLWSARQYLDGTLVWPLGVEVSPRTGRRYLTDDVLTSAGHSRTLEVAAALELLTNAGLDPQVLIALRETPWVTDAQAFAAVAMRMSPAEAVRHAEAGTFPHVRDMLTLAALTRVDLSSIYDEGCLV